MIIDAWGGSRQGHGRAQNQDAFGLDAAAGRFVLCDGMGGHAEGGRAAQEVVAAMLAPSEDEHGTRALSPTLRLKRQVLWAHQRLCDLARSLGHQGDMGCTLACLRCKGDGYLLATVGDSRAYLRRDGRLAQLSEDHTVVAGYLRGGVITAQEAANHPQRHILNQAMGMHKVEPDVFEGRLLPGDRFLLTSDGVHGVLADHELDRLLAAPAGAQAIGTAILDLVQKRLGHDDATVVAVFVGE